MSFSLLSQQTQLLADFEVDGLDRTFVNWNASLSSTTVDNPSPDAVNNLQKLLN